MQWVRSLVYTGLMFLATAAAGVVVLVAACLPLSIEQRYTIPRTWGRVLTWLAGAVCGLRYTIEGRDNLPARPFISLWKHSSAWETMAQMFVVPPSLNGSASQRSSGDSFMPVGKEGMRERSYRAS